MKEHLIIDSDAHIRETEEDFTSRLEPEYTRLRFSLFPADNWDRFLGRMGKQVYDLNEYLQDMDTEGIDVAVLYPTRGLNLSLVKQPALAVALARAWNDFIGEVCATHARLRGVAMVSLLDVPEAVKELNRAVTAHSLEAVMIHCHGYRVDLGSPTFWPLYEEAQRLNVPVAFHPNAFGAEGTERWNTFLCTHAVGFAFELMQACLGIMVGGVLEHCPQLRVGFFEGGCGWVPYWLERIDEHYEKRPEEAPLLRGKPSEYVKDGRVFFSFEPEDSMLPFCLEHLGEDVFLFASDYPHWDMTFPHAVSGLMERPDVTAEQKRKLTYDNAFRFYTNLRVDASTQRVRPAPVEESQRA
jgi:predicted TIM-barrel fold metal-dependent hydrolase